MPVNILFIADIIGKPGRKAVSDHVHRIIDRHRIDCVIANGENAAGGFGITEETADELFAAGVHVITTGNHVWDKKDSYGFIAREKRLVRPANYPEGAPGRGHTMIETPGGCTIAVINLEGRAFMGNIDCPFRTADALLEEVRSITPVIVVDFHAEATSEKQSLGWYLDGRVSAVIGTHTHVQTADERILSSGTAYISDAGMTGSSDSVLGMKKEQAIYRFLSQLPAKFEVAKKDVVLNGVVCCIDQAAGHALSIERIAIPCG